MEKLEAAIEAILFSAGDFSPARNNITIQYLPEMFPRLYYSFILYHYIFF